MKINGGVGEISGSMNEASPTTEPPEYIWSPSFAQLLRARCIDELENVAIAMHCNLRPTDDASILIRFNYDPPMPSLKSLNLSAPVL